MRKLIYRYVQECTICHQQKHSHQSPAGILQPFPIPSHVWADISLDFIKGLAKSQGFGSVLVVVDRLTKYGRFFHFATPLHFTAFTMAAVFIKEIVRLHGFPSTIDRDRVFLS